MARVDSNVEVILNDVRLSFEHIFRPQVPKPDKDGKVGEPSYNCSFLISKKDKKQDNLILDAIDESMRKMWGDKPPKIRDDRKPYKDGDDYEYDGYPGNWVLSARNARAPKVVHSKIDPDSKDGDFLELFESDGVIYSGCRVNAIVRIWSQDSQDYGKRVNCSLEAVQFFADDDSFGGAAKADTGKFKGMEGEVKDGGDFRKGRDDRRGRDDEDDRGSRRGRDEDDRGSKSRSRDDDDDRGSRGRDRDDDRGRGKDKDDDDRDTRSSRRGSRDEDDGRSSSRSRDRDEPSRDRGRETSSRGRSSEDDDARSTRGSRDREDDRGSRDRDERGSGSSRSRSSERGADDDRERDRGSSRSRSDERDREDDRGSSRGRGRDDDDRGSDRGRGRSSRDDDGDLV